MAQLLSNLPNRALIKFGKHQVNSETAQPIVWMVADKNHSGYPSNSVTLITEKIIDLRAYDGKEETWGMGYVDYGVSNINQWLNSDAAANKWYSAAYIDDAPPTDSTTVFSTEYQSRPGFLYNFTTSEKLALLPTSITVQNRNDISSVITTKVFIPSLWEVLGTHSYADGSSRLACFSSGEVRCVMTSQAYTHTTSGSKPSSVSDYHTYYCRSTYGEYVCGVSSSGQSDFLRAFDGSLGIRPMINLTASTLVSDTTDSDGCYTIFYNQTPVISGTNGGLGVKSAEFGQTYTITDGNNDAVTVTEYIDNVVLRSYVATLGATNTFSVTGNAWRKLSNGNHTLKIVATDGFATIDRTYNFTKSVTKLVVQRATPLDSSTQPKSILVTVVKVIPDGATFKVEACNNAYDASPTWEDITTKVTQGRIYDFTNKTKTASNWGVNVRVTVNRNGKAGACYITEIGGNFE